MKAIWNILRFSLVTSVLYISFQGTVNAQYSLETITVIGNRLAGIDQTTFPLAVGQGPDDRSEAKRVMKCTYLSSVARHFTCPAVPVAEPNYLSDIKASTYYSSAFIWSDPLVKFARNVWSGDPRRAAEWGGEAYRDSIERCKQSIACLNQVTHFLDSARSQSLIQHYLSRWGPSLTSYLDWYPLEIVRLLRQRMT
jgi:hypothetical protein